MLVVQGHGPEEISLGAQRGCPRDVLGNHAAGCNAAVGCDFGIAGAFFVAKTKGRVLDNSERWLGQPDKHQHPRQDYQRPAQNLTNKHAQKRADAA
ncbi:MULTISPECIES: hypothetical protein [unclassified Mesorhizobium]|uniref:hypothetical protein n=1 Tax=unclassified Mesorhizobium TaxID=325217 RepID=UPI001CCC841F|nr:MULTISPECIES: hypothetical protein [unclassified Mesorhizobium]MBZ9841099.1 hypothetical protein [Mesorhizobium sp. CA5]